jgi:hypothetical protein
MRNTGYIIFNQWGTIALTVVPDSLLIASKMHHKEGNMLRIATKTKLTPEDTISKAITFFGPQGYKLKVGEKTDTTVEFEGGGGSVEISACKDGGKTTVDFLSREWDYQVKEFIKAIR